LPKVAGLLLGFIGVVILMSKDLGAPAGSLLGQLAVVAASVFYAGSSVYARRSTGATHGILRSVGPLLSSTALMWIAVPVVETPFRLPQLPITWVALLWLGILGSGFAFILSYYLIHAIGPTRTTMVTYLFPLGGILLGVGFLGERLTWQLLAGGLLIIASLAVANLKPKES